MSKKESNKDMTSCVYCGKKIPANPSPFSVHVVTRSHPVCSLECRQGVEEFVRKDKKNKKFMYYFLVLAALLILVGSLIFLKSMKLLGPGIAAAGCRMFFFPYPVNYFDNFYGCCIKKTTVISRVIGAVLMALGVFFFITAFI